MLARSNVRASVAFASERSVGDIMGKPQIYLINSMTSGELSSDSRQILTSTEMLFWWYVAARKHRNVCFMLASSVPPFSGNLRGLFEEVAHPKDLAVGRVWEPNPCSPADVRRGVGCATLPPWVETATYLHSCCFGLGGSRLSLQPFF